MWKKKIMPTLLLLLGINLLFYFTTFIYKVAEPMSLPTYVLILSPILTTIFDASLYFLFPKKLYRAALLIFTTLLKVSLSVFYKEFGNFDIFSRSGQAGELKGVIPVILHDINFLMILMLALMAWGLWRLYKAQKLLPFNKNRAILSVATMAILTAVPVVTSAHTLGVEMYSTVLTGKLVQKINTEKLYDPAVIKQIKERYQYPDIKTNRFTGIAKGKNVLFIQCESLQNTFVNRKYNGQEITPFLNQLIKQKGTIYFDDYFELLGLGNTSDAEFVSMNGVYASAKGQAYDLFDRTKLYGMPQVAKKHGYDTLAFHGNSGSYYDRDKHYPALGFNGIYLGENLVQDEVINMGLSDGSLFRQMAPILAKSNADGKNFFALAVTLTTHTPFVMPENLKTIEPKPGDENDFVYNYANCARYTDDSLKALFQDLAAPGTLQNTLLAIYSDHPAMTIKNPERFNSMTKWLGREIDYDEMMNIPLVITVPGLQENVQRKNIGSQVDLYPTILNLLGWDRSKLPIMGIDLLNDDKETENNVVFPQTHLLKGSFITKDRLFEVSRDNIFEHSRLIDRKTRKERPVKEAASLYQRATLTLDYAYRLMRDNRLMDLIESKNDDLPQEKTIMHGGGELDTNVVTNMMTAVENSYARGKRIMEIDFSKTTDGHYIGLHGWDGSIERYFPQREGKGQEPISHEEFMAMEEKHGWQQLDLYHLVLWMEEHPNVYIVTDIKKDNIEFLSYIAQNFAGMRGRFIPQIYRRDEYDQARALGFHNIIYTLYQSEDNVDDVIDFVNTHPLYGVTISDKKFKSGRWKELLKTKKPVFVHTINDEKRAKELLDQGVSAIYTDSL
ncbi:sulfatase-like hydrolase/transferase [Aedoeadaptatus coxii]|uniref:sulfatase-like hydrolase/transferase n=1 Tax=Aedoeadaptatus coxii TaxID=755172 RepID=UPI002AD3341A|nr:sulfatase-like hydrolase/transferase [Peptoniphilus coxii]